MLPATSSDLRAMLIRARHLAATGGRACYEQRWRLGPAAVAAALMSMAWLSMDHSRRLEPDEVAKVVEWVQGTQSGRVAGAFRDCCSQGGMTERQLQVLLELAKEEPVPPGLYEPVRIPE